MHQSVLWLGRKRKGGEGEQGNIQVRLQALTAASTKVTFLAYCPV
jgi:hypothetical protein